MSVWPYPGSIFDLAILLDLKLTNLDFINIFKDFLGSNRKETQITRSNNLMWFSILRKTLKIHNKNGKIGINYQGLNFKLLASPFLESTRECCSNSVILCIFLCIFCIIQKFCICCIFCWILNKHQCCRKRSELCKLSS